MEFGNYGYKDEMTGAGWQTPRTNMESEIPLRHWHLNDPGVVPNLLQTGAGSPCGICVYEGRLLPKAFWDQVIHCDAGPNVVRAYPAKKDGAGYAASELPILTGTRDKWFRPSDVCVAPDGSLIVADWYDPGVGGHRMGDVDKGRLFRVAPPKTAYKTPKYDFTTIDGCIEALKSPNLCARYLAWTELHKQGDKAEPALKSMYETDENPRFRARALWLLTKLSRKGPDYVAAGLKNENPDLRIVALRAARELKLDVVAIVSQLVRDPSPEVRRECAIALRHNKSPEMPKLWGELARQHDGKDRWYLEALGISADKNWDACLAAAGVEVGNGRKIAGFQAGNGRRTVIVGDVEAEGTEAETGRRARDLDLVWRSRAAQTPGLLVKIITDPSISAETLPRYLRAFDFQTGPQKDEALVELAFASSADEKRQAFVSSEALARLKGIDVSKNPQHKAALARVLDSSQGTKQYVDLVNKFNVADRYPELLLLAQEKPGEQLGVEAMRALLAKNLVALVETGLKSQDAKVAAATAEAVGNAADAKSLALLMPLIGDKAQPLEVRRQAVRGVAQVKPGAEQILKLASAKKLDAVLDQAVAAALHASQWPEIKAEAAKLYPLPPTKNNKPLPPITELAKLAGNAQRGKVLYNTEGTCAKCHVVNGVGKEVGPNLSEIGNKLARQALHESILFPSAGISHNYETWVLTTLDGGSATGLLVSQTDQEVTLKGADALVRTFKRADIDEMAKQPISLMPADVQKLLTQEDLVDIVEYLTTLKKAEPAGK